MQCERFTVGSIECQILPDGEAMYLPADLAAGVPADEIIAAHEGTMDENGRIAVPYNCLLIRAGGRIALVDTGLGAQAVREFGAFGASAGRLMESLTACGIAPGDVDLVIISHAHPDHIAGLTAESGGARVPVFSRARHYFWQSEWDFWTSEEGLAEVPELLANAARRHLPPVQQAGLVELVNEETDVLPGVRLLPAPGHTPGHMALAITSGDEGAIYLGDAILGEANFDHPDWVSPHDSIPALTVTTRERLLDTAIREKRLLIAFHLAVRGYADRINARYRFRHTTA